MKTNGDLIRELDRVRNQCSTRSELSTKFKTLYVQLSRAGLMDEVRKRWPNRKKRDYVSAYSDQELLEHARQFDHCSDWKVAGNELVAIGKSSPYNVAKKRGREFFVSCTVHMVRLASRRGPKYYKYSDDEVTKRMLECETPSEFKSRFRGHYLAAHGRPRLKELMADVLVPAANPYAGDCVVYVYEFEDRHAYIGLTFRPKGRHDDHLRRGPVFRHISVCPSYEYRFVEEKIMSPAEASSSEKRWLDRYRAEGWTMLNLAEAGGLGTISRRWTAEACLEEALKWPTRKAWYKASQVSYLKARERGFFEECAAHMPRYDASRLFGREASEATRKKMAAAKKGRKVSDSHWKALSAGQLQAWSGGRNRRYAFPDEMLLLLGRRQPHNAVMAAAEEVEFLRANDQISNGAAKNSHD